MTIQNIKRILVTGGKGQLGSEIGVLAPSFPQFDFTFIDMEEVDLASEESIRSYFFNKDFDAVIHCAAYTAVDLAEDQPELAFKVNASAVKLLAEICRERTMRLFHISTDYVFDGNSNAPIAETQAAGPVSVYGKSKLEGEQHALAILPDCYIIRTAWVYSTFGKNFVKTMLSLGAQREELNVVYDQIGSPTYAADLAEAVVRIADSVFSKRTDKPGIYHYTNEGVISWYDFAWFIMKHAGLKCRVNPVLSSEYKTKAVRPKFSVLDKKKIRETFDIRPPYWHASVVKCIDLLISNSKISH